jgi:hypothetical protein
MACTAGTGPLQLQLEAQGHEWRSSSCYRWWSTLREASAGLGEELSSPCRTGVQGHRRASIYQDTHPGLISMSSFQDGKGDTSMSQWRTLGAAPTWQQDQCQAECCSRGPRRTSKRCSFKITFKGVEAKSSIPLSSSPQARLGPAAMTFCGPSAHTLTYCGASSSSGRALRENLGGCACTLKGAPLAQGWRALRTAVCAVINSL